MYLTISVLLLAGLAVLFGFVIKPEARLLAFYGLVALFVLGVGGYLIYLGMGDEQKVRRVMSEGRPGIAIIREMHGTGVKVNKQPQVRLVLDVALDDGETFVIDDRYVLPFAGYSIRHGQRLRVLADRQDRDYVVIDWNAPQDPDAQAAQAPADLGSRLQELDRLRAQGLISEAEHQAQRERLLSEL